MFGTILLIILFLVLLGVIPHWGYSRTWGYAPSGFVATLMAIVLAVILLRPM